MVEYKTETKNSSDAMVSVDTHQLDEQVKSMMSDTGNKMTYGNQPKKYLHARFAEKKAITQTPRPTSRPSTLPATSTTPVISVENLPGLEMDCDNINQKSILDKYLCSQFDCS